VAGSIANLDNMRGAAVRRALYNVVGNISRGQLEQFGDWVLHDQLRSRDHAVDYREGLCRATAPALLIAGSRDRLAPPAAVRAAFDRLGSADKELLVLGRETGTREEYGHGDLVLGCHAPTEVFPLLLAWLERHSAVLAAGAPSVAAGHGEREPAASTPSDRLAPPQPRR
jgi:pimeloyl-ACP methyl ester carboxylesterase